MFDSSALFHASRGGGVYNYLLKLLPLLSVKVTCDGGRMSFLHLHSRKEFQPPDFMNAMDVRNFYFPVKLLNRLWIKYEIPDMSLFYKDVDIFHSPHFSLPVMSKAKKILTVNDITYLRHPEYFHEAGKKLNEYGYNFLLPTNIRRADRIIAISEFTKSDIIEYFKIPEEKISVVHIGCDIPLKLTPEERSSILAGFGLIGTEYIYFPAGTLEPRKNIRLTIEAFKKAGIKGMKMVISGIGDYSWLDRIAGVDNIQIVRWENENQKNALFQGAAFVVYPSLYEGFGMPVVEAMGNGKAVLTSNTTSLKEIADGYAHMVNPEDEEGISQGVKRIYEDIDYRNDLEMKSTVRAEDFTWEKMASQTYDVYKRLLSS
ncbi:MAG: hypothetical protein A2X48_14325 [Lentisphaerae bacterium GWF2_49_21]|nr:MAG: hypothetical protein A2X48_14325 [Lentisphaerae bacterium GWF2_49_21]